MEYLYQCDNIECKWYNIARSLDRALILIPLGNDLFYKKTKTILCVCGYECRQIN